MIIVSTGGMTEFNKQLVPNYIFAGAIIAVFLFGAVYVLLNADTLVQQVTPDNPEVALAVGGVGGAIITTLIVIVKEVVTFFFRKTPE